MLIVPLSPLRVWRPCHDGGCAIGAGAVRSGGVALPDYESKASYKLSQVIFVVFFAGFVRLNHPDICSGATSSQAFQNKLSQRHILIQ
jgi:hypothetical protein